MGVESDAQEKLQPQGEPQTQGHDSTQGTQTESEEAVSSENVTTTAAVPESTNETVAAPETVSTKTAETAPAGVSEPDWHKQLADKDAEIARLKETAADEKVGYELRLAGAKNVKAAKALLDEHKGDIAALKAAEPWMFETASAPADDAPTGKTGLSSAGAATDEGAQLKRWRRLAGLEDETK